MSRHIRNNRRPLTAAFLSLMVALIACGPVAATPTAALVEKITSTPAPATTPSPTLSPIETPTSTRAPTVLLIAQGGNLHMRRGPGAAYNILAVLQSGQQGTVTGRNEASTWFAMEIPGQPGTYGWVSGESQFSEIQGDPAAAPVVVVEAAVPAYIRNCVFHPILLAPGNVLLAPQFDDPANKKQLNPGIYEGFDQSVEGYPKVFAVELREGRTVDITEDGLGNHYACP